MTVVILLSFLIHVLRNKNITIFIIEKLNLFETYQVFCINSAWITFVPITRVPEKNFIQINFNIQHYPCLNKYEQVWASILFFTSISLFKATFKVKLPGFHVNNFTSPDQDRVRTLSRIKHVAVSYWKRNVIKAKAEIFLGPWIGQQVNENELFQEGKHSWSSFKSLLLHNST